MKPLFLQITINGFQVTICLLDFSETYGSYADIVTCLAKYFLLRCFKLLWKSNPHGGRANEIISYELYSPKIGMLMMNYCKSNYLTVSATALVRDGVCGWLSVVPWAQYSIPWFAACGFDLENCPLVGGTWGPADRACRAGPINPPHPNRL